MANKFGGSWGIVGNRGPPGPPGLHKIIKCNGLDRQVRVFPKPKCFLNVYKGFLKFEKSNKSKEVNQI